MVRRIFYRKVQVNEILLGAGERDCDGLIFYYQISLYKCRCVYYVNDLA